MNGLRAEWLMAAGLRPVWVTQQIPPKRKRNGDREREGPIRAMEYHYPIF